MRRLLIGGFLVLMVSPAWAEENLEKLLEAPVEAPAAHATAAAAKKEAPVSPLVAAVKASVRKPSSEQIVFLNYLEASAWEKALLQYQSAFAGSEFERTSSGRALLGLLEFQSGLKVTGVEKLFSIKEPKAIHSNILNAWREAAPETHPVWGVALIEWHPAWTETFSPTVEMKARTRELSYKRGIDDLKGLAQRAPVETAGRSLIEWNLALAYALDGKADQAAKVIAGLFKAAKNPIGQDLMNLTAARLLFQNGYFEAAIKYYEKVPKASDYWVEAQEEIGWAFMRKGEPQNALAVTQTLVNPSFIGQVGPETFFLRSVAQLRVCDYPAVVESLNSFPQRFKARTLVLNGLSENANQPAVVKILNSLRSHKLTPSDLGKEAQNLPRFMTRDERLQNLVRSEALLEGEAKAANDLYVKSLAQTGLQAFFDGLKKTSEERAHTAKTASFNRVQEMARNEVNETKKILDKMHIVEAEVIQQVALADRLTAVKVAKADLKTGTTGSKAVDTLHFPAEKEVWFDELSNFKVDIKKGCQAKR